MQVLFLLQNIHIRYKIESYRLIPGAAVVISLKVSLHFLKKKHFVRQKFLGIDVDVI